MEVTFTCLSYSFCVRVQVRKKVTHAVIHANLNAHQHAYFLDILKKTLISCTY